MIAAGVNAKALSSYTGHASVSITFDRYGHLMPGNEAEGRSSSTATSNLMVAQTVARGRHQRQKPTSCSDFASTATGIRRAGRTAC